MFPVSYHPLLSENKKKYVQEYACSQVTAWYVWHTHLTSLHNLTHSGRYMPVTDTYTIVVR